MYRTWEKEAEVRPETRRAGTHSDRECTPLTTCAAHEWEVIAPTNLLSRYWFAPWHDRVCAGWTVCTVSQWEAKAPGPKHDRDCRPLTVCNGADEWEMLPPTATSDRVCAAHTTCAADQFESRAKTATSDRE